MIDALFSDSYYVTAKKMLDVSVLRHEAIASNLANIETPNYKRMDVASSFESQLQSAIGSGNTAAVASLQPQLAVDTTAVSGRADGNTVQLESEMLRLNENTVENAVETELVNQSLAKIRMAVTGKS
ncbi:MAG TPA: flagellar basal body rod protein FlgB [Verrucomicrobiae bacterium]|jgi:flagellar basal-body rod protein FlgB|nr:flagellar basal body rod protein FlgB [Verrucomicrobiae bacterium]